MNSLRFINSRKEAIGRFSVKVRRAAHKYLSLRLVMWCTSNFPRATMRMLKADQLDTILCARKLLKSVVTLAL